MFMQSFGYKENNFLMANSFGIVYELYLFQIITIKKQVEKTYKSSKAVPDQKGVEEGGTKLQSGGVTKENPQNKEGAQRRKEKERSKEHLGVGKTYLDTAISLSITLRKFFFF